MSIIPRDWPLYVKTTVFGTLVYAGCYSYLKWTGVPSEINKAAADTAILLIGSSMLISSLSYFFNFLDWSVAYRKHLGLIGLAFALSHLFFSWNAFLGLLQIGTWEQGRQWPAATGAVALFIFLLMALVSNTAAARKLGKAWRPFLRVGYIAVALVLAHVVLLKSGRWTTWYQAGMETAPSLSLLVTVFMVIVLGMRLILWFALLLKPQSTSKV